MTIRQIARWWQARCRMKAMERAYPTYADINQQIREARKRHEPVAHLYTARIRFVAERTREAA